MSNIGKSLANTTAALARSITRASSKQTYYTALLFVDKDLLDDFYRAYAYFRWVDDFIDISSQSNAERSTFIRRQKDLINNLFKNSRPNDLFPEEQMVADLISHDWGNNHKLQSSIHHMLAIIEFDAFRMGQIVSRDDLAWYTNSVGKSVTYGLQYFIGNGHSYPDSKDCYSAAIAAHLTHLLRDWSDDVANGFFNIPREFLESHNINPKNADSSQLQSWVRDQVGRARQHFREGRRYIERMNILRSKIVAYWYCARFEGVLDAIERDNYILRTEYNERRNVFTWLKIAWISVAVTLRHIFH